MQAKFRLAGIGVVVVLAVAVTGGCMAMLADPPRVIAVYGDSDSRRLGVSVNTCNRNPQAVAEESAEPVTISVTADPIEGNGQGDCRDSTWIQLEEPLGSREVIDAESGDPMAVKPLER